MREPKAEIETKRGVVCDLCGKPRTKKKGGRIFSFTGRSWIKLHESCVAWMNLSALLTPDRKRS